MRFTELEESSPLTFRGSITPDLLLSKLWLCLALKKLNLTKFDTVYILGSWYGNMAYALHRCNFDIDKIINIDIDKKYLDFSNRLLDKFDNVFSIHKDANQLNYKDLTNNSLVINTSSTDMPNNGWLDNIPKGTLVAIQDRDNSKNELTLEEFDQNYPLSKTLYLNKKTLQDPEVTYQRFMKIGIK